MFYTFGQNNTGGSLHDSDTLTHFVIIEADTASAANEKMESLGGYFNGCDDGMDCDCCGDRWYGVSEHDAESEPLIYGKKPADYVTDAIYKWMADGKEVVVHYADGRAEWF